jgi:hypothetical protein
MKRLLFSIFILTVVLFNSAGYLLVNKIQSISNQEQTAAILRGVYRKAETSTIILNNQEFSKLIWEGNNIEINDRLYAVVGYQKYTDQHILSCYFDHNETLLKKSFKQFVDEQGNTENPTKGNSLKNLFSNLFHESYLEFHYTSQNINLTTSNESIHSRYLDFQGEAYAFSSTPPPQFS